MADDRKHTRALIGQRILSAVRAGDWKTVKDFYAADFVREDRRLLGMPTTHGPDAQVARLQGSFDAFQIKDYQPTGIASRGDRLSLNRLLILTAEDFEFEVLSVTRLDADGRIDLHFIFDPDDLDAAMAELDRLAAQLDD